jgi:ribosomal protein S18 acetylase RimI-like enzyme
MMRHVILNYSIIQDNIQDNISQILAVEDQTIQKYGDLYDTKAWTKIEFLATRVSKDKFSCAVIDNGNIQGFSIAYEADVNYAHISRLAVGLVSGKGYGSGLLDFQLNVMKENGVKICSVDLISKNSIAFQLYQARGFQKLEGSELLEYIKYKQRDHLEYLGDNPSHIAMIKKML